MFTLPTYVSQPTSAISVCWSQTAEADPWALANLYSKAPTYYSFRREIVQTANSFSQLKPGWLGAGSYGISKETIKRVVALADTLERVDGLPNPELTPNVNGTISLEWESARGEAYFELGKTRLSAFIRIEEEPTQYIEDVDSLPASFFVRMRDVLYPSSQSHSITASGTGLNSYAPTEALELSQISSAPE